MNRPQRNNNPLNLRYAGQIGAIGKDFDGFAIFETPMDGWEAAHKQIKLDQDRDLTFKEFINKFAPPNENDTDKYTCFVCAALLSDPDDMLVSRSRFAIAGVMAKMEGYYRIEP